MCDTKWVRITHSQGAKAQRQMGLRWSLGALLAGVLALGLVGCAAPAAKQSSQLKIGVLPILDALPMYVAEQDGFFTGQGLQVELVLFPSALERDSAMVAGQIDGELNDPISVALMNKEGDKARIVRLAFKGNESMPMMVVLASPNSKAQSARDLKGVPVGVSQNSVIEYSTDRLLQSAGLAPSEIEKIEVTKIPIRAEMLAKGQIQAATLPEPLASLAVQQGARVLIDDRKTGTGQSTITFRQSFLSNSTDAVRRFLAAYEKGVEAIERSPNSYRDLMVDKAKVPDSLRTTLNVPLFPKAQISSREDLGDVVTWMVEKKLLDQPVSYESLVAPALLPGQ